jgi:hypothetical protein
VPRFLFLPLLLSFALTASAAPRVWYVDNSKPAGDGSAAAPFATLQAAESASADGDTISVAKTPRPYAGPLHLKSAQALTGAGDHPRIEAGGGSAIVLASSNRIENIAIRVAKGTGITASGDAGKTVLHDVTIELNGGTAVALRGRSGSTKWTGGAISGSGLALQVDGGSGELALDSVPISVTDSQAVDVRNTAMSIALSSVSAVAGAQRVVSAVVVQDSTAPFVIGGGRIEKMVARAISITNATQVAIRNVTLHENAANGVSATACGEDLIGHDNAGCNAAIYLRQVRGAVIDGVRIEGSAQVGINGVSVTDLTVANTTINDAGNEPGEHAINFTTLLGHSTFTALKIRGTAARALNIENGSGEAKIDIVDSAFTEPGGRTANQGVLAGVHGDAKLAIAMRHCTLAHNPSAAFQATATDRGTLNVTVENNTFTDNGAAVTLVAQQQASMYYAITANTATGGTTAPISVSMAKPSSGRVSGSIVNNTIGRTGVAGSGAHCGSCNGIAVWAVGDGRLGADISGNTIRQVDGAAIRVGAGDGNAEVDVAITGNRIEEPGSPPPPSAVRVQSGTSGTDHTVICATIGGAGAAANQISGGWATGIEIVNRFPGSVFRIAGYRGDGKNLAAVAAHVSAANHGTSVKPVLTKAPEGNAFAGADACTIER